MQIPTICLVKPTSVRIKVTTDGRSCVQCIQDEDLTLIIKIIAKGTNEYFLLRPITGEFVCPLDVEALPEDVVNSRPAEILELLWPLTCLHYCLPDL